ncbi:cytochrome c3 family protein [Chondromyces crocatus]|uniref:Doubled CXXCH motif domain-containing protein n=1 Tax=Chondromyces crocatus TaxID=52 RepID=A0A0K1EAA8_CHOCO|nr:cytochrome c3 family protein [Chondromyces crocatus]AKT37805.1 uncharacterized protein CMC5_019480 [Chondromyces crocatus]
MSGRAPRLLSALRRLDSGWLVASLLAVAGCAGALSGVAPEKGRASGAQAGGGQERTAASNVLRQDYAGSAACVDCHGDVAKAWRDSPMHRMTRLAEPGAIRAPFDGRKFHFKSDVASMETHEDRRYMRIARAGRPEKLFKITKVIGGRFREDYVGVEVTGTGAQDRTVSDPRAEPVMPVSWLLFSNQWRYKGYSVMVPEREGLRPGMSWRQTCIYCHNTAPYFASLYDDLLDGRKPYQGSVTDRLLPLSRQWKLEVTDEAGLRRALEEEIGHVSDRSPRTAEGSLGEVIEQAIKASLKHVDQRDLVEVGIGCESCHNGSKEHAASQATLPTFEVKSTLFEVKLPAKEVPSRASAINRVCSRCHSVLLSAYEPTWEGGSRNGNAGGSSINSGEGRDFLLGGCANAMSCVDCHDPHAADEKSKMERLGTVAGNGTCVRCHGEIGKDAASVQAHTHHAAEGAGSACVACHMPRKNMALDYSLTRYHRIGSPTDEERVERDRPLECALCHVDKSVAELSGTMEGWWGKKYDRKALEKLYGKDLGVKAMEATLAWGLPHEQVVAAAAMLEASGKAALPRMVPMLAHPYPLARYFVGHAMEKVAGVPLGIDLDGEMGTIAAEARRWVNAQGAGGSGGRKAPAQP